MRKKDQPIKTIDISESWDSYSNFTYFYVARRQYGTWGKTHSLTIASTKKFNTLSDAQFYRQYLRTVKDDDQYDIIKVMEVKGQKVLQ